jgi:predicted transcriptional regulator
MRSIMLDSPVSAYMRSPVFSIEAGASLDETLERMERHAVSSLAVSDNGNPLAGVVTRTDLLAVGNVDLDTDNGGLRIFFPDKKVREVASPNMVLVDPEVDTVRVAAERMTESRVHRVFAAKGAHLYGVFSTRDALRALADARVDRPISEVMSTPIETVSVRAPIDESVDRLRNAHVSGLVVVDAHGSPVGIFTQKEALESRGFFSIHRVERVMSRRVISVAATTAIHLAAAQAYSTGAKHAVVVGQKGEVVGIASGLDFARAAVLGAAR